MLEFFGNQKYFKKVSQNKNIKYFLYFYFFGVPKKVYKLKCIELENVLDFNEKKN